MNTMRKVVILLLTITLTTITSQAASQRIVVKNEKSHLAKHTCLCALNGIFVMCPR